MVHFWLKMITGAFVVPLGFLATVLWEWWEKQEGFFTKYMAGAFILPLGIFMWLVGAWWDEF